jgi:hypothetical protein
MESHQLLREVFQKTNMKEAAAQLGLSLSMLYKWSEPPGEGSGSGASNPLDRMDKLVHVSGDTRLVQWICEKSGGFFIRNPKKTHPQSQFLIPATNEIIQEFADLLEVVANAAADNHIDKTESHAIRARWEELKSVTEGFVRCCEEGHFTPIVNSNKKQAPAARP